MLRRLLGYQTLMAHHDHDAIENYGSHEPNDRPKWNGDHRDEHGTIFHTVSIRFPSPVLSRLLELRDREFLSDTVVRLVTEAITERDRKECLNHAR
jgi:hypothetical protein